MEHDNIYEENGVTVSLTAQHEKPTKCKTFLNPKMGICREFVLTCLKTYCDEDEERHVKCLDAFGATGIAGLQWKRHLGSRVDVTINDISAEAVTNIQNNCALNNMLVERGKYPDGFSVHNTLMTQESTNNKIEVISADANVTMHLRQFHFIHVDPFGSTVNFLDAAFRNIYNKGLMVVTSTDVSALYGKAPQVTQRNYGAHSAKTDFYKEMAARTVLTGIARAAARCNKGIEVLYTVAVEHFVQVAVRIKRGALHADTMLTNIRDVLHCKMCEEYAVLPDTHVLSENLYEHLPCSCYKENPGRTAVKLGPMWCGDLYSTSFLQKTKLTAKELKLSDRLRSLLDRMEVESRCPLEDEPCTAITARHTNGETTCLTADKVVSEQCHDTNSARGENGASEKRKQVETAPSEPPRKRVKRETRTPDNQLPPFYYDIHRQKIKDYDIPKADKFVSLLREEGFRACRTTFDCTAVRTNAVRSQVVDVIIRRCSETPKPNRDPK